MKWTNDRAARSASDGRYGRPFRRLRSGGARSTVLLFQSPQVIQRLIDRADVDAGHPARPVQLGKEQQVVEVRVFAQPVAALWREGAVAIFVGVHVVADQEPRAVGDQAVE